MATDGELILRLLIAGALAGCLGLERQLSDEAAGLRTHVLVGLGACLFSLLSVFELGGAPAPSPDSRVAAGVVSGIGFLGAGAILRSGFGVRGLTTAASLWLAAGLGMAVAFGHYVASLVAMVIAVVILAGAKRIESLWLRRGRSRVEIRVTSDRAVEMDEMLRAIGGTGALIREVHISEAGERRSVGLELEVLRGREMDEALRAIEQFGSIESLDWTI